MSGNKFNPSFFRQPRYYNDFQCIGGSCPVSCCVMWDVDWTEPEIEKLKNAECSEQLRNLADNSFRPIEDKPGIFRVIMDSKKRCTFLTNDNFCLIQRELGEEYLSNACMIYPRNSFLSENTVANYCYLSCYKILDTLCNDKDCMILENYNHVSKKTEKVSFDSKADILIRPELKYRNQLLEFFYEIISDESRSLETSVTLGAVAAQDLAKSVSSGGADLIPERIAFLKKMLKDPKQTEKLENLKPNYAVKLGFVKKLDDIVLKTNMIKLISENGALIAEKYDEGMRKFNAAFAERPFALRNIALNLLLELNMPFRSRDYSIFENYCYYAAAIAAVKLTAAAIFIKNKDSQAAVTPVVTGSGKVAEAVRDIKISFKVATDSEHKFKTSLACVDCLFAHNNDNVQTIIDMYNELNCMSPAYIALILK